MVSMFASLPTAQEPKKMSRREFISFLAETVTSRTEASVKKISLLRLLEAVAQTESTGKCLSENIGTLLSTEAGEESRTETATELEDDGRCQGSDSDKRQSKNRSKKPCALSPEKNASIYLLNATARRVLTLGFHLAALDGEVFGEVPESLTEDSVKAFNDSVGVFWRRDTILTELKGLTELVKAFYYIRKDFEGQEIVRRKIVDLIQVLKCLDSFNGMKLKLPVDLEDQEGVDLVEVFDSAPINIIDNFQPSLIEAIRLILDRNEGVKWNLEELNSLERIERFLGRFEFIERMIKRFKSAADVVDMRVIRGYTRIMRIVLDKLSREDRRKAMRLFYTEVGRYEKENKDWEVEFEKLVWEVDEWGCNQKKCEELTERLAWYFMMRLKGKGSFLFRILKMAIEDGAERPIAQILCQLHDPVLEWQEKGKSVPVTMEALQHLVTRDFLDPARADNVSRLCDLLVGLCAGMDPMMILSELIMPGIKAERKVLFLKCLVAIVDADIPIVWCGKKGAESAWDGQPEETSSEAESSQKTINVPKILGDMAELRRCDDAEVSGAAYTAILAILKAVERKKVSLNDSALDYIESLDAIPATQKFQLLVSSGRKPPLAECFYDQLPKEEKDDFRVSKCPIRHQESEERIRCVLDAVFNLYTLDEKRTQSLLRQKLACLAVDGARGILVKKMTSLLKDDYTKLDMARKICGELVSNYKTGGGGLQSGFQKGLTESTAWECLLIVGEVVERLESRLMAEKYGEMIAEQLADWSTDSTRPYACYGKLERRVEATKLGSVFLVCDDIQGALPTKSEKLTEVMEMLFEKKMLMEESVMGRSTEKKVVVCVDKASSPPPSPSTSRDRNTKNKKAQRNVTPTMSAEESGREEPTKERFVAKFPTGLNMESGAISGKAIAAALGHTVTGSPPIARRNSLALNPNAMAYSPKRAPSQSPPLNTSEEQISAPMSPLINNPPMNYPSVPVSPPGTFINFPPPMIPYPPAEQMAPLGSGLLGSSFVSADVLGGNDRAPSPNYEYWKVRAEETAFQPPNGQIAISSSSNWVGQMGAESSCWQEPPLVPANVGFAGFNNPMSFTSGDVFRGAAERPTDFQSAIPVPEESKLSMFQPPEFKVSNNGFRRGNGKDIRLEQKKHPDNEFKFGDGRDKWRQPEREGNQGRRRESTGHTPAEGSEQGNWRDGSVYKNQGRKKKGGGGAESQRWHGRGFQESGGMDRGGFRSNREVGDSGGEFRGRREGDGPPPHQKYSQQRRSNKPIRGEPKKE